MHYLFIQTGDPLDSNLGMDLGGELGAYCSHRAQCQAELKVSSLSHLTHRTHTANHPILTTSDLGMPPEHAKR